MPVNKNALIRYKTIDNCLRNHFRRWTIDDLVEACSDTLRLRGHKQRCEFAYGTERFADNALRQIGV